MAPDCIHFSMHKSLHRISIAENHLQGKRALVMKFQAEVSTKHLQKKQKHK